MFYFTMDIYSTKPMEEVDINIFKNVLVNKEIFVSPHALDHLSRGQRKVFKEQELINILRRETPRKVYLQRNERYAVYYRKSDGFRKLILDIKDKNITIITFIDVLEIPKIILEK